MPSYTIPREGQRSLRFDGEEVAYVDGSRLGGRDQTRYYKLAVYCLDDGRHLVHWHYRTNWQGEMDRHDHAIADTLADIVGEMEAFDPLHYLVGYRPILERYESQGQSEHARAYGVRQERVEADLLNSYRQQVMAICEDLGVVEDYEPE